MKAAAVRCFYRRERRHQDFEHLSAEHRPTFHSVRALASYLYKQTGHDVDKVQQMMAHTHEEQTEHYQWGHDIGWTNIDMTLNVGVLGGRSF